MDIREYDLHLSSERLPFLVEKRVYFWREETVTNPEAVEVLFNECFHLKQKAEEYLYMLALSAAMQPVGIFEVSHGIINSCFANPREIFIRALLCGANSIILVHNHTSGKVVPSEKDIQVCHRIKDVGELIGVELNDFLVLGEKFFSFAEEGILS